ncbi:hypothetical protein SLE2022_349660 [Rubroshorea leprosula]
MKVSIEDIFDAPINNCDWKINARDELLVRYSLLQKLKRDLDNSEPIYEIEGSVESTWMETDIKLNCVCSSKEYFLYGEGLHPFRVNSYGLIIPKKGRCPGCLARKRVNLS